MVRSSTGIASNIYGKMMRLGCGILLIMMLMKLLMIIPVLMLLMIMLRLLANLIMFSVAETLS